MVKRQGILFVVVCVTLIICVLEKKSTIKPLRLLIPPPPPPSTTPFVHHSLQVNGNQGSMTNSQVQCNVSLSPEHTHPPIALASFPGSGNTWARHLIEQATGIYTGSIYGRFKGETIDYTLGRTLTVKIHGGRTALFDAAILLIRDPYKAMLAEFNRQRAGKTGIASHSDFRSKAWQEFVNGNQKRWQVQITTWLNFTKPLLVVKYSDLKQHTIDEVGKIVKFLGFELTAERRKCLEYDMDGIFKRTGHEALPDDPFTPDMHKMIDPSIAIVNKMLIAKGYDELEQEI
ncbi:sialate:O-sulfotransferase 2-like [Glandiceps talaboti]